MTRITNIAIALLIVVWSGAVAVADSRDEAREHYSKATSAFAIGDFVEAAGEYQAAYRLKPDPALLFNAAQSWRLAGNYEKALVLYRNYASMYPNEPNVELVRQQIVKMKEAIAASDKAKSAPPTGTVTPKAEGTPPAATATPSTTATATEPSTTIQATPPAETSTSPESAPQLEARRVTPLYKRWWLWTLVGVVVGGGVTAALVATLPSGSWANAPDAGPGRATMGLGVRW